MEHIAYKSKPVTDKKDNNHADICGCGSNADIYTLNDYITDIK